jgi:hypothetical protein
MRRPFSHSAPSPGRLSRLCSRALVRKNPAFRRSPSPCKPSRSLKKQAWATNENQRPPHRPVLDRPEELHNAMPGPPAARQVSPSDDWRGLRWSAARDARRVAPLVKMQEETGDGRLQEWGVLGSYAIQPGQVPG